MNRTQSLFAFVIISTIVGTALLARPVESSSTLGVFLQQASATPAPTIIVVTEAPPTTATPLANSPLIPTGDVVVAEGEGVSAEAIQNSQNEGGSPERSGTADGWNPPPMVVPIASHPWDHYWFNRPVSPNNNNFALPHYTFGSNGGDDEFRIHHGIDIANPIGVDVFAASDGIVQWSGKGSVEEDGYITAYGETIVIKHDYGYKGETIYTLYAHLSTRLVENGERVSAAQVIGLIGNTGNSTGPHVHFEVRIGRNRYNSVFNPLLWIAPYDGTGVVAGRILLSDGTPAYDSNITVIDRTTGDEVFHTSSYAGGGIESDPNWNETFVIPDLPAGRYLIVARQEGGQWAGEVIVVAGTTNWIEMNPVEAAPDSAADNP